MASSSTRSVLHVSLAQLRPEKGRPAANLERVRREILRSSEGGTSLLVFPETFLSGYLLEGSVEQAALACADVAERLGTPPEGAPDVVVGFYERADGLVYNTAAYLTPEADCWTVAHRHRKVFLPTYGMFQEARFVTPGEEFRAFDTRLGRMGLLVCEDLHHSMASTVLALDGADLLVALGAAPARDFGSASGLPRSMERWDVVGRAVVLEHATPLVVAHLVGSEGGKLMGGGSVAYAADGEVLARGPLFREASVNVVMERGRVERARIRSPLLPDLRNRLPRLIGDLQRTGGLVPPHGAGSEVEPPRGKDPEAVGPTPRLDPGDESLLELDYGLLEEALVSFLQQEIRDGRSFEQLVIGLSGGVDSAVALLLSVKAFGAEAVHAFSLPYATSSPESLEHARLLATEAGVSLRTISISSAVDAYIDAEEPAMSDRRRGNVAARVRATVLWDQAARLDALVMGTGNKSERLLGYFTWHADDSPPVNPLGDLFKTQVLGLARHLGVPEEVVAKPPSADLVRGVDDETELGISYADADPVLHHLISGVEPGELVEAGFDAEVVDTVRARLEGTHWKRRLPTVAMVSSTAIGESYLRPVDL